MLIERKVPQQSVFVRIVASGPTIVQKFTLRESLKELPENFKKEGENAELFNFSSTM